MLGECLRTHRESRISPSPVPSNPPLEIGLGIKKIRGCQIQKACWQPRRQIHGCNGLLAAHNPFLPGIRGCLRAVNQVQFTENITDMPLDRAHADHQLLSDPIVG